MRWRSDENWDEKIEGLTYIISADPELEHCIVILREEDFKESRWKLLLSNLRTIIK